ncbi:hypothetical protein ACFL3S_08240, partial [Gemmatimonadota bacterium]
MRRRFEAACRWARRVGVAGFWILAASTFLSPAPIKGQGSLPEGWDGGLFEIRVPGIAERTVLVVLNPEGEILLPVSEVLGLTESVTRELPDGILTLSTSPDAPPARLYLGRSYLITPQGDSVSIGGNQIRLDAGRLYLAAEVLGTLLEGELDVEWDLLRVTLTRDPPFPVEARTARVSNRNRLMRPLAFLEAPVSSFDAPLPSS